MDRPAGWRKGQTIFNFLQWLKTDKDMSGNQNGRMADPFFISDELWDKYWKEFMGDKE